MSAVQIATRVDADEVEKFRAITKALGTTPADALRMFVVTFNSRGGFPYETRLSPAEYEAFTTEKEAAEFVTHFARKALDEIR